jgi:hypothetical protein
MPFRSEKQRRYLWKNNPEIARKWTNEHGSTPVKAKKGKYQELEHPDHEIKPIEHKEENVSSKERVEKLLDERKTKKETKKKLVKQGQNYVPGWRPNLSVKAKESKYIQKKPSSKWDKSIKNIEGMTAKELGSNYKPFLTAFTREIYKRAKETARGRVTTWDLENARRIIKGEKKQLESVVDVRTKGGPIKAKKGLWTGAKTNTFEAPPGWDAKKISDKTGKKLDRLFKHRERGGYKQATDYKKYLKGLKKATTKTRLPGNLAMATKAGTSAKVLAKMSKTLGAFPLVNRLIPKKHRMDTSKFLKRRFKLAGPSSFPTVKSKSLYFKDIPKGSKFLQRRMTLGGPKAALAVLKAVGRRTHIGKAVAAATVVAGAYEAGKRKLFTKDKKKKKVQKKSTGGEIIIGRGVDLDLL